MADPATTESVILDLAQRLGNISGPVFLALALVTGYFQQWVWGRQLREMQDERDYYRDLLFQQTKISQEVVKRIGPS